MERQAHLTEGLCNLKKASIWRVLLLVITLVYSTHFQLNRDGFHTPLCCVEETCIL